jgi:hypothetical protein
MNKSEAQALTAQIRSTAHGLWRLVAEAYDRKAWQALGYSGWKEYAELELQMSESRSYQLVDTGRVMKAIGEATQTEEVFETIVITARETAKIKPHLSTFKKDVTEYVKDGLDPAEAVDLAIENLPTPEPRAPREPRVIEGDVVPQQVEDEPKLPELVIAQAKGGRPVVPIGLPMFSGPGDSAQPIAPKAPRGKKICPTCGGHGYV